MKPNYDQIDELMLWSANRIAHCREQELKFGRVQNPKHQPPQALIEAWTERRALQAVRRILGWDPELASSVERKGGG